MELRPPRPMYVVNKPSVTPPSQLGAHSGGIPSMANAYREAVKPDWKSVLGLAKLKADSKEKMTDVQKTSHFLANQPEHIQKGFVNKFPVLEGLIAPVPEHGISTTYKTGPSGYSIEDKAPIDVMNIGSQMQNRDTNTDIAMRAADRGDWDLVRKVLKDRQQAYNDASYRAMSQPGSAPPTPPPDSDEKIFDEFLEQWNQRNFNEGGASESYEPPPPGFTPPIQNNQAPQGTVPWWQYKQGQ